jgi:archaetidylinositol phosphate synthase
VRAVLGDSWIHQAARRCITPLAGTWVTPNHLTTLRLLTGLAACACFATGIRNVEILGGFVWILSAFLDRADGELARLTGQTSAFGHRLDSFTDMAVASLFFFAAGIGSRDGLASAWSIGLGALAGTGVLTAELLAERIDELKKDTGERAYPGFAGFDFDDILILFAVVVWLDWQLAFVSAAAIGAPAFAFLTWKRYLHTAQHYGR